MTRRLLHLDLTTARLFVAAVEKESIADAAREEGIAASALSKRIQLLEAEVEAPLFRRHRRGIEITGTGMIVLRRARAMLNELRQLEADLSAVREGLSGRVLICANETALADFVPRILPSFVAEHPNVEIALEERTSSGVVRAVWQNAADIGIYVGDVPPVDLWRRPIFHDRLAVIALPSHPLASRTTVSMRDILEFEVIGQAKEGALSSLLARAALAHHRALKMRLFADRYNTVCSLVACGLGLGIVPEGSAQLYAQSMNLVSVSIGDQWAQREHHVCVRSLNTIAPPQRALLDYLLNRSELSSL